MIFAEMKAGAFIIDPEAIEDERGFCLPGASESLRTTDLIPH
jgi:hypothetical protein